MIQQFTHFLYKLSLIILSLSVISGCHHTSEPVEDTRPAPRTVLVYMVANCNLGMFGYDALDIDEMREGAKTAQLTGEPGTGRLLIYHAPYRNKKPVLYEMTEEGMVELKTYPAPDTAMSSIHVARMRQVIDDVKTLAPNRSYGLVLWSHATSFRETGGSRSIAPRSYGDDNGLSMKIPSLAKALEGHTFDFIYTDVCHMATVEVAYELRHATPLLIGSTTELDVLGMPYHLNIPEFFKRPEADVVAAAKNTMTYYTEHPRSGCSMSVIATAPLDRLAAATRNIMMSSPVLPDDYRPVRYYGVSVPCLVYDFAHYMRALRTDPALMQEWEKAFAETVLYKDATDVSFTFDMTEFTGLGAYLVLRPSDVQIDGYANQSWYRDVIAPVFAD